MQVWAQPVPGSRLIDSSFPFVGLKSPLREDDKGIAFQMRLFFIKNDSRVCDRCGFHGDLCEHLMECCISFFNGVSLK